METEILTTGWFQQSNFIKKLSRKSAILYYSFIYSHLFIFFRYSFTLMMNHSYSLGFLFVLPLYIFLIPFSACPVCIKFNTHQLRITRLSVQYLKIDCIDTRHPTQYAALVAIFSLLYGCHAYAVDLFLARTNDYRS